MPALEFEPVQVVPGLPGVQKLHDQVAGDPYAALIGALQATNGAQLALTAPAIAQLLPALIARSEAQITQQRRINTLMSEMGQFKDKVRDTAIEVGRGQHRDR
jgi:hypothetical protein